MKLSIVISFWVFFFGLGAGLCRRVGDVCFLFLLAVFCLSFVGGGGEGSSFPPELAKTRSGFMSNFNCSSSDIVLRFSIVGRKKAKHGLNSIFMM